MYKENLYKNFEATNVDTSRIRELRQYEFSKNIEIEKYIRLVQDTVIKKNVNY